MSQASRNQRTLFLDLDGTLLDVQDVLHRLYRDVVVELGGAPLARAEYLRLKRDGVVELDLVARAGLASNDRYTERRSALLETEEYLLSAPAFPRTEAVLSELARQRRLVLVTLRRDEKKTLEQIERAGLARYFAAVHVAHDETKAARIRRHEADALAGAALVGDTEVDVATGKELDIVTIAVASGIRSRQALARLGPDHVVDAIDELAPLLATL
jgi:phosphoglycolate phosphatase-like HAD superfamily hydrolase